MKEFIEKWNSDFKFKTKVKFGASSLFVLLVAIFALTSNGVNPTPNTSYGDEKENIINDNNNITVQESLMIKIPEEYSYTTNIFINDEKHVYNGNKRKQIENINKILNEINKNYIYQDENYYQETDGEYILTNKEEVYDIISNNYLKLETVNQYLTKSTKQNENNIVYLKDIILGYESEKYITITITNNQVKVDYTSLMEEFDNSIQSCIVEITIEEIE